jgi:hypothetical protein
MSPRWGSRVKARPDRPPTARSRGSPAGRASWREPPETGRSRTGPDSDRGRCPAQSAPTDCDPSSRSLRLVTPGRRTVGPLLRPFPRASPKKRADSRKIVPARDVDCELADRADSDPRRLARTPVDPRMAGGRARMCPPPGMPMGRRGDSGEPPNLVATVAASQHGSPEGLDVDPPTSYFYFVGEIKGGMSRCLKGTYWEPLSNGCCLP